MRDKRSINSNFQRVRSLAPILQRLETWDKNSSKMDLLSENQVWRIATEQREHSKRYNINSTMWTYRRSV